MRNPRRLHVALLILLLLGGLFPVKSGAQEASPTAVQWWGPTEAGQGFHMRVPITVTNHFGFSMANPPAAAQIDLGQALKEAGWITAPNGDRDILQSFLLSLDSIRVVAMTNFEPPRPGSTDGQLRVIDPSYPHGDPRRFEVPSMVFSGYLDKQQPQAFHARTNPVITVLWEVPGTLQPTEQRYYMIYFDTPLNREHLPPDYTGTNSGARLQGLYWSGPGLELIGLTRPGPTGAGFVTLVGLQPDTTVHVHSDLGAGQLRPVIPPKGFPPNPTLLGQDQVATVYTGTGTSLVRILADKPVLGFGTGTGFVPSIDAGMTGREFVFAKTNPAQAEDETIHFVNPGGQPTTVVVQPLGADGTSYTFRLSDGSNPYPYTVGARSGPFNGPPDCDPANRGSPSPLLPAGPGVYRAVVVSGGPVLLQHAPSNHLFQVPSSTGAPLGASWYAATSWRDQVLAQNPDGPVCRGSDRTGGWFASGLHGSANIRVTSLESSQQIDPPGTVGGPAPPARPVGAAPVVVGRHPASVFDRPLLFSADADDVALFVGWRTAPDPRVPGVHGPLGGGEAGRHFASLGPTRVYAPYNDTIITASLQMSGSGIVTQEVRLRAHGSHLFTDLAPNDWLYGLRIDASRPIMAYPLQADAATWAAVPSFLQTSRGPAEFRGHLIDLSSPSGLDPLTGSTVLGQPMAYAIKVTNLGRGVGGANLPDTVDLRLTDVPTGWTATLDRTAVPLHSGQSEIVHLTVTPESSVTPGSVGVVGVHGQSRSNPHMTDTLTTVTYIQRSFDVGLWFELINGPKSITRAVGAGNTTEYNLVVQNRGSVADSVRFEMTLPTPGWRQWVLRQGIEVQEVALPAGAATTVTLRVEPPEGGNDGLVVTTVTAKSVSSPAALDRVTATTRLRVPSDITLHIENDTAYVMPGNEAVFPVHLTNQGLGSTEVFIEASVDAVPGWSAPSLYVADPFSGQRVELDRISLAPGDAIELRVAVRSPPDAPAAQTVGLRLAARPAEAVESLEGFVYAMVRPLHALAIGLPPTPIPVDAGPSGSTFEIRVENQGNLDERLTWRARDMPSGWRMEAPEFILVPRNATQAFDILLHVPQGEAPGLYNITAALLSNDGNETIIVAQAAVGTIGELVIEDFPTVAAQPGRPAYIAMSVRNVGNVPTQVQAEKHVNEQWQLESSGNIVVPPGATATLAMAWIVPPSATDGTTQHTARVLLTPLTKDAVATFHEIVTTIDIGRAEVQLEGFRAYAGPAGMLIDGYVTNTGTRSAYDFRVELLSGQDALDSVSVAELPTGGRAAIRLLAPYGHSGDLAVVADREGDVVEGDRHNNVYVLDQNGAHRAPASGTFAILLVLLAHSAFASSRRERK